MNVVLEFWSTLCKGDALVFHFIFDMSSSPIRAGKNVGMDEGKKPRASPGHLPWGLEAGWPNWRCVRQHPGMDTRNRGDSKDVLNRRIEIMEILFILSAVVKVCMLKYASRRKEMDRIPTRGSAVCVCLQSSWVYAVSWWKVTASWWANIFVECGGTSENIEFLSA